jgi:opacity protein-like surface antigen
MTRSSRPLLAAAFAALLCAAPDASAQVPGPPPGPPPGQPPPPAAPAQLQPVATPRLQIGAFTGWQVNGDVDGIYGKLRVDDAQSFGVSLWTQVRPGTKIELLWIYSRATAQFDSYTLSYSSTREFDVDSNYFQIGGVQSMRRGKIEPFAGGTLGAVWYAPGSIQSTTGLTSYSANDTWRFAITLGGGLNVFLTESVAIRGYARMLVPMYFNGGSVYVGTGGSGLAVNAGVPAISGDFGAAIVLAR